MRSVGTLLRQGVAVFAVVAVLGAAPATARAADFTHLSESRFDELLRLPQWIRVARELPREGALVERCRKAGCGNAAALRIAGIIEASARADDRAEQIRLVHDAVNRRPYREDLEQFGREDLWQSPLAFAARGGDCEDFAIAKYFVLTLLGVPPSDLRIAVLTGAASGEVHAVLLARADGRWHVLDNREDEPRPLAFYRDWTPQYAVSEAGGFRYRWALDSRPDLVRAPAQR